MQFPGSCPVPADTFALPSHKLVDTVGRPLCRVTREGGASCGRPFGVREPEGSAGGGAQRGGAVRRSGGRGRRRPRRQRQLQREQAGQRREYRQREVLAAQRSHVSVRAVSQGRGGEKGRAVDPVRAAPAPPIDSRTCDRVPPHPVLATRSRLVFSPHPHPPPRARRTQLRPTKAAASGSAAPAAASFPSAPRPPRQCPGAPLWAGPRASLRRLSGPGIGFIPEPAVRQEADLGMGTGRQGAGDPLDELASVPGPGRPKLLWGQARGD